MKKWGFLAVILAGMASAAHADGINQPAGPWKRSGTTVYTDPSYNVGIATNVAGSTLTVNGSFRVIGGPIILPDLTVLMSTASLGTGSLTLDALTDVVGTGGTEGQALLLDGSGMWRPGTISFTDEVGARTLGELADVNTTGAVGDTLKRKADGTFGFEPDLNDVTAADGTGGFTDDAGISTTNNGVAIGQSHAASAWLESGLGGAYNFAARFNNRVIISSNTPADASQMLYLRPTLGSLIALKIRGQDNQTGQLIEVENPSGLYPFRLAASGALESVVSMAQSTHTWDLQNSHSSGFSALRFLNEGGGLLGEFGAGNFTASPSVYSYFTYLRGSNGLHLFADNTNTPALTLAGPRNVGINTTTPSANFEVKSSTTGANYVLKISSQDGNVIAGVKADGTLEGFSSGSGDAVLASSQTFAGLNVFSSTAGAVFPYRITAGTTIAGDKALNVEGDIQVKNLGQYLAKSSYGLRKALGYIDASDRWVLADSTYPVIFNFSNSAAGWMGIGTYYPVSRLTVSGTMTVQGGDLNISTPGAGVRYPDATKQTTAYTGSVPATGITAGDLAATVKASSVAAQAFQAALSAGSNITLTNTDAGVQIAASGGGSSSLLTATGTTSGYTSTVSTTTTAMNFDTLGFVLGPRGSSITYVSLDTDLIDLADGLLSGSKIGSGVPAANIAAGSLGSSVMVSSVSQGAFYSNSLIRSNLGLAIGSDVQAFDAQLSDLADGTLSGDDTVAAAAVAAGSLPADVMVSSVSQGAFYSNSAIRSALGLAIGSDVQGFDAQLSDLADGTLSGDDTVAAAAIAAGTLTNDVKVTTGNVAASGTAQNGTYLEGDGSWSTPTAAAGGTNGQVQYNEGGVMGGDSGLSYSSTTKTLTVSTLAVSNLYSGGTGPITIVSSATTLQAGVTTDIDSFKLFADSATIDDDQIATAGNTMTLTGKTFDAAGTGNVLKMNAKDLWSNADFITTATNPYSNVASSYPYYSQAKFDPGVSTATNKVFLKWFSGADFDTGVVPTCVFSDMKSAVDTSTRGYIVSISSVSAGDDLATLTFGNIIRVKVPNTSTGGAGTSGISASTTLTGWNSFIAANTQYIIQIAREGDSAVMDPSTVGSYFNQFHLVYGTTQ